MSATDHRTELATRFQVWDQVTELALAALTDDPGTMASCTRKLLHIKQLDSASARYAKSISVVRTGVRVAAKS